MKARKNKTEKIKKPLAKWKKWLIAICVWGFAAYALVAVTAFIPATISAGQVKDTWMEWQKGYIEFLESSYETDNAFSKVDESQFITSDLSIDELYSAKFNQLRYLATHNSYKAGLTPETKYLYHGPFAAFMGKQFDYVFDTLTDQFNAGVRSIELDFGKVETDDGFTLECVHSDLLETNSTMVNVELGFREIAMWLDRNPDSVPITILVEPKGGTSFDAEAYELLDAMILEAFGDKLITPKEFLGDNADFAALRKADNYPTIGELRGRVMFILHEKDSLEFYIERESFLETATMFLGLEYKTVYKKNPEWAKHTLLLIINKAKRYGHQIDRAIDDNYMVRTRLDKYAVISEENYKAGLASNANILSTDYPPTVAQKIYDYPLDIRAWDYGYTAVLYEQGKTLTLRR